MKDLVLDKPLVSPNKVPDSKSNPSQPLTDKGKSKAMNSSTVEPYHLPVETGLDQADKSRNVHTSQVLAEQTTVNNTKTLASEKPQSSTLKNEISNMFDTLRIVRGVELLVEEAQERATKPWYRRLPKDL